MLKKLRGTHPCTFLILCTSAPEDWEVIDNIEYHFIPYPYEHYIWHNKQDALTPKGIEFELKIAQTCYLWLSKQTKQK